MRATTSSLAFAVSNASQSQKLHSSVVTTTSSSAVTTTTATTAGNVVGPTTATSCSAAAAVGSPSTAMDRPMRFIVLNHNNNRGQAMLSARRNITSSTQPLRQQNNQDDEFYEDEDAYSFDSRSPGGAAVDPTPHLHHSQPTSSSAPAAAVSFTDSLIEEDNSLAEEVVAEEETPQHDDPYPKKERGQSRHYAKGFKQGRREYDPERITSSISDERHGALSSMMNTSFSSSSAAVEGGSAPITDSSSHQQEEDGRGGDAKTYSSVEGQLVQDAMLLSYMGNKTVAAKALSRLQGAEPGTDAHRALQTLKRHQASQGEITAVPIVTEILEMLDNAKNPEEVRRVFEKHILTNPLFNDVFNGHGTRVAVMGKMTTIVAKTFSSDVFLEIASLAVSNGFNLTRLHVNELLTAIRVDLTAMFQQHGRDPKIVMTTLRRLQICMALSKQDGVVFEGVFLSRLLLMCTIMVTYFDRQNYYRNSFPADFMRREGLVSDWVVSHVRAADYDECVRVLSKFVKENILDDQHLHSMCIRPGFTTLYRLLDFFFATDNLSQMLATMEEAQEHLGMNLAEASIAKMMQLACSFNYPMTLELFRKYRLINKESLVASPDISRLLTYFGRSGGGMHCPHCKEPYNHRNVQLEVWESTPVHQRACPLLLMQREQRGELEELSAVQPDSSALDAFKEAQTHVYKVVQARVAAEQESKKKADEKLFLSTGKDSNNNSKPSSSSSSAADTTQTTSPNTNITSTTPEVTSRVDADLVSFFPAEVPFPPEKCGLGVPEIDSPQCRDWSGVAVSLFEFSQSKGGMEWGMAEWRGFLQCCTFLREPEDIMSLLKKDIITSEKLRREHADKTLGHTDLNPSQAWRILPEDVPIIPSDILAKIKGGNNSTTTASSETLQQQHDRSVEEEDKAIASLIKSNYALSINNVTSLLKDPNLVNLQKHDAFFLVPNGLNEDLINPEEDALISRAAAEFHAGSAHLHNILRLYRLESAKDVVGARMAMIRKMLDDGSAAFDAPRVAGGGGDGRNGGEESLGGIHRSVSEVLEDGHHGSGGGRQGGTSHRGVGTSIVPQIKAPEEQFKKRGSDQNRGGGRNFNNNKPKSPFDEEADGAESGPSIQFQYELFKPLLHPSPGTPAPAVSRRWITLTKREKFQHILYNILQPNINRQKHFEDIIARLYLRFLRINEPALVYPTIQDWYLNGVGLGRTRRGGEISPVISEEIVLAAFSMSNDDAKLRADAAVFATARVRAQDLFLMAMAKRRARFALWANGILVKLPKKHPRVLKAMSSNAHNIPDPHERRIRRSEERRNNTNAEERLVDVVLPPVEQSRFADSEIPTEAGFVYMINPCAIGERLSSTTSSDDNGNNNNMSVARPEDVPHNERMLREYVYLARKVPRNIHARVEFKDSGSDIVPNSGKKNWYMQTPDY